MAGSSAAASTSSAGGASVFPSASLYVGDLGSDVTEAHLFEIFNAIGPVASVRVCRDAATRRSLGYAYVNFHRPDDAEKAMSAMNFNDIRGKQCRIMWSHRDPSLRKSGLGNIFVKNLAKSIDNRQLYDTFSIFGSILSCKVAANAKGESLGYGFVHFETEDAAQQAISKVDGKLIAGQKVNVAPFKSKRERGETKTRYTNIYVKNLPLDVTKDKLDEMFGKHGKITSSMLATAEDGKSRGFGFVNFETPEQAQDAVNALNNLQMGDKTLFVARAQKREERERELRERFEKLRVERVSKFQQGLNLYVKNFPDDWDDKRLRDEFAKFGSVTSARVMRDQGTGKSKGFGFVSFSAQDEVTKAVTGMNNTMIDGKPLYVALAQRKEQRRAEMERVRMGQTPMFAQAPMYYGGPQRGGYMYPAGGMPRGPGWVPMPGQGPMMGMGRVGPQGIFPYGPVPFGGRGAPAFPGGVPPTAPGAAGARPAGGRGRARAGPPAAPQGAAPGGPKIQYEQNVRNRPAGEAVVPPVATEATLPAPPAAAGAPGSKPVALTIKQLAGLPDKQKKQIIGEQLFVRIKVTEQRLAGKITGMLLEMDNAELIHLLESPEALQEKIQEAKEVLQQHEAQLAAGGENQEASA